jgi:hypothetical protein
MDFGQEKSISETFKMKKNQALSKAAPSLENRIYSACLIQTSARKMITWSLGRDGSTTKTKSQTRVTTCINCSLKLPELLHHINTSCDTSNHPQKFSSSRRDQEIQQKQITNASGPFKHTI